MQREWGCCGEQFDASDAGEDEGGTQEGAGSKMLMQDKKGGQAGEDGFESEQDSGVGWREMLLRPALDGEGGGGSQQAGDGEGDDKAGSYGEMRSSAEREGDGNDERGYTDLKGGKLAGWNSVRCVGEGEKMAREGDSAGKGQEITDADAGKEVLK